MFFSSVQILAEEAHSMDSFDLALAQKALTEANNALATADNDTARAEFQIEIETAEALIKAIGGS